MEYLLMIVVVIGLCLIFWQMHEINKNFKKEQMLLEALMIIVKKIK